MECDSCGGTTIEGNFCPRCGAPLSPALGDDDAGSFWGDSEPTSAQPVAPAPDPPAPGERTESSWEDWLVVQQQPAPLVQPLMGAAMTPGPPPRSGGVPLVAVVAAGMATLVLLGLTGGAAWFFSSRDDATVATSTTSSPPTTVTTTQSSTTPPSPTTTTVTTTSTSTTTAALSPQDQLNDLRDNSLASLDAHGDWAVSLSAKQDGTRDDDQITSSGSHVFRLPDILELHQTFDTEYSATATVYLLKAEDLGSTKGPEGDKIWMTIVDPGGLLSRDDAELWCELEFPHLTGTDLDNACYPRRLTTP